METTKTLHQPLLSTSRLRELAGGHPLLAYFVLAFGFAWIYELIFFGWLGLPELPWLIPAAFAPPIAAILVTRSVEGTEGARDLLRHILMWRVALRWYALILVAIPAIALSIFALMPDGTKNFPSSAILIVPTMIAMLVVMFFFGGGQEELGWRGFALPRMQSRFGPLSASIILGAVWGLWHLPLFVWIPGYDNAGSGFVGVSATFLGFVGYTVVLAIVLTWIYNRTNGSVFMTMLMHGIGNVIFAFSPSNGVATASTVALIAAVAVLAAARTRGALGYEPERVTSRPSLTTE